MGETIITEDYTHNTEYKFSVLFDLIEIQKLQDLFTAVTGIASIITEPDGTPITEPSGFCSLCNEIRKTDNGLGNCMISNSIMGSPKNDGPKIQRCLSGGLLDGAASIIFEGKHIANWLIGQVLDEEYNLEDLFAYADVIGVKHDVYRNELFKVKRMSKMQFENLCNSIFLNAQQFSSKYVIRNSSLTHELEKKIIDEVVIDNLIDELEIRGQQRITGLEKVNAKVEETNVMLEKEISQRKKAEAEIKKLNENKVKFLTLIKNEMKKDKK